MRVGLGGAATVASHFAHTASGHLVHDPFNRRSDGQGAIGPRPGGPSVLRRPPSAMVEEKVEVCQIKRQRQVVPVNCAQVWQPRIVKAAGGHCRRYGVEKLSCRLDGTDREAAARSQRCHEHWCTVLARIGSRDGSC